MLLDIERFLGFTFGVAKCSNLGKKTSMNFLRRLDAGRCILSEAIGVKITNVVLLKFLDGVSGKVCRRRS